MIPQEQGSASPVGQTVGGNNGQSSGVPMGVSGRDNMPDVRGGAIHQHYYGQSVTYVHVFNAPGNYNIGIRPPFGGQRGNQNDRSFGSRPMGSQNGMSSQGGYRLGSINDSVMSNGGTAPGSRN